MPFDGPGLVPRALMKMDAAIGRIDTVEKWCKGAFRSHDGRYCIRGAVRAEGAAEELEPYILQAIGEVAGRRYRRIEQFNDHPNTSHAQMLAVLERARSYIAAGLPPPAREPTRSLRARLGSAALSLVPKRLRGQPAHA